MTSPPPSAQWVLDTYMDFQVFHDYARLARRGLVEPLACPHCGFEYVTRIGEGDEPVLQCFGCNSITKPGLALYENLIKENKKYYG